MKNLFLFFFLISFSQLSFSQSHGLEWARSMGGMMNEKSKSIAADNIGNVYTVGSFESIADFNPDTSVFNLSAVSNTDIFISKLNSNGHFIWAKQVGGTGNDIANSIDIDLDGNIYITGVFEYSVDFDPNIGIHILSSSGAKDVFVAKYDSYGNLIWAKSMGGPLDDIANSITLDQFNNVYSAGYYFGVADFDPDSLVFNLSSMGNSDIFISKFNATGDFVWAKSMGGDSVDICNSITIDIAGNVLTTGIYYGQSDFDPGIGNFFMNAEYYECYWTYDGGEFISKLDSNGNFVWAKNDYMITLYSFPWSFSPTWFYAAEGKSILTDSNSNIYTLSNCTTFTYGSCGCNPGMVGSSMIIKSNSNGILCWVQGISYSADSLKNNSMIMDPIGNLYCTSYSYYSGKSSISKLDTSGNIIWTKQIDTLDMASDKGLAIDHIGNLFATGSYTNTRDFNPGSLVNNQTAIGGSDAFIQKFHECTNSNIDIFDTTCAFSYILNGYSYSTSGNYQQVLTNSGGCDSVINLHLIFGSHNYPYTAQSGCSSYTFAGQTYTNSGYYTHVFTNSIGCDSIINFVLTLHNTTSNLNQAACNSFSMGGQTYTSSGNYTHSFTNTFGCDSVINLSLLINDTSSSTISAISCKYFYYLNGIYYTADGIYTQTLQNSLGCDSILTLHLTFNVIDTSLYQTGITLNSNVPNAIYQWVNCPTYSYINGATNQSYTPTANGTYAIIISQNGCIDTSSCYVFTSVDLNDIESLNQLNIYPNPTTGKVIIYSNEVLHNANINVKNMLGQIIIHERNIEGKEISIDISNEANGTYIIEIFDGGKLFRKKILKEK